MDTNETCISYFARVYGIDFTETEGGMKDEEFCALEDALQEEITSVAEDLCEARDYPVEAVFPEIEDGHNEGVNEWVYKTAQGMSDEELIADLKKEMKELVQNDIDSLDTDEVFVESVYERQLNELKTSAPVRYYITADAVRRDSQYYQDADDVIGNWTMSVEETSGDIPADAVEVVFETNVEQLLDPEYAVDDLGRAIDLAWAIHEEISLNRVRNYDTPVVAFCYADDDGWDKVQAILDGLPGRN